MKKISALLVIFVMLLAVPVFAAPAGEKGASEFVSSLEDIRRQLFKMGDVLGLFQENAKDYFAGKKASAIEKMSIDTEKVQQMIEARTAARKDKDWKKADQIRDELLEMHVILEDRADGTVWNIDGDKI